MDVMRFYENVCKLHNCHSFAKNTKCLSLKSEMCRIGYILVVSSPFIHYVQLCVCRRVRHDHFSYQNRNCNQTGRLTDLPWRRQVNLTSSCKQFFSFFFFFISKCHVVKGHSDIHPCLSHFMSRLSYTSCDLRV